MRIGIMISALAGGRGPARFTGEIANALMAASDRNDEFLLYGTGSENIKNLDGNFTYRKLPMQRFRPWLNWTLPFAARKDRIDVMFFPANDCWLWRATPCVVALLDLAQTTFLYDSLPGWKDRLQVRLQMRRIGAVSQKLITISHFSATEIGKAIPAAPAKLEVVYCGIGNAFGTASPPLQVPEPYILFVGGFDRRKNLDRLLQAFGTLREKGRREKLLLVGSGGANSRLYYSMPELINRHGLAGTVEVKQGVGDRELAGLYGGASLLVLPSIIEGFGLPVVEAQACGCPVACSTAASLPEVGGNGACYFDPFDVAAIAGAMERVLTDRHYCSELRSRGFENARRFSWKSAGERVCALLQEAARP